MGHPLSDLIATMTEANTSMSAPYWDQSKILEWCQRNQVKLFEREFIELVLFQSFNLWQEFVSTGASDIYLDKIKPVMDRWYIKRMKSFEDQGKVMGKDRPNRPKPSSKKDIQAKMAGSLFPSKTVGGSTVCPKCLKGNLIVDGNFLLCEHTPRCDYVEVL